MKKFKLLVAACSLCSMCILCDRLYAQSEPVPAPQSDSIPEVELQSQPQSEPQSKHEPQPQPEERSKPFLFSGAYTADAYYNMTGGLRTGGGFMGMGNLMAGFDTEAARWWKGGSFFVNGAFIHGKSLSGKYIGDLQIASNIDAGEHIYLHELWFRQHFSFRHEGTGITLTLGLQDLNAEFMVSEEAGEFLNSSFGVPPVIAVGIPVPIFPLTGLGVAARWDITGRWAVQAALFDGNQTSFEHNPNNVHWSLSKRDGLLVMGEAHFDGRYKLGAYYHSADKNYGFYALVDQPVGNRVSLFGQIAVAPKSKNDSNFYIGAGANLAGVFSKRGRDGMGLAVASAGLHRTSHKHETTVELYYRYNFSDHISLQPDLQYIINPSGGGVELKNALAGILRLRVAF